MIPSSIVCILSSVIVSYNSVSSISTVQPKHITRVVVCITNLDAISGFTAVVVLTGSSTRVVGWSAASHGRLERAPRLSIMLVLDVLLHGQDKSLNDRNIAQLVSIRG